MDEQANQIVEILKKESNLKAVEIAKRVGLTRKEVNHYLYYELINICISNDNFEWRLRDRNEFESEAKLDGKSNHTEPDETPDEVRSNVIKEVTGDKLQRLCRYYIECVLLEQDKGIEVFKDSKFDPNYIEIDRWPKSTQDYPDRANAMIQKIMTSNSVIGYYGYPTLLKNSFGYMKLVDRLHFSGQIN